MLRLLTPLLVSKGDAKVLTINIAADSRNKGKELGVFVGALPHATSMLAQELILVMDTS